MKTPLTTVSVWLAGILVAAALGVGAQAAFAQPVTFDCQNNGSTLLGACANQQDCVNKCNAVWGVGGSTPVCTDTPGCCRCLI